MSQVNVITDLGSMTKVPNKILTALVEKELLCIGSSIKDAIDAKEDIAVLNIGIGTLSVEIATMQCKFVPSSALKTTIKRCISEKIDPLEFDLEQAFIDKLQKLASEGF